MPGGLYPSYSWISPATSNNIPMVRAGILPALGQPRRLSQLIQFSFLKDRRLSNVTDPINPVFSCQETLREWLRSTCQGRELSRVETRSAGIWFADQPLTRRCWIQEWIGATDRFCPPLQSPNSEGLQRSIPPQDGYPLSKSRCITDSQKVSRSDRDRFTGCRTSPLLN